MTFWLRLFFPKTVALEDREVEIAHQRTINAKLIDALVRERSGVSVFTEPSSAPVRQIKPPMLDDDVNWREEAMLRENERLVREAAESPEGYADLQDLVDQGVQGARELLMKADQVIAVSGSLGDEERVQ